MLLKFFQNWSEGFGVIPIFHFFEVLRNFSFLGLSREPFGYVGVPGDKKVFTHDKKTFEEVIFKYGGVRKNLYISIMLNYLVTPLRYINTSGGKKLLLMTRRLVGFCIDPMVITVVG